MKKYFKIFFVFCVSVCVLYVLASIITRNYVSGNRTIEVFGEEYTQFNYLETNFIPFNSDNSWYETDADTYSLLGLSFLKNDKDKKFVYYNTILGTKIYKKDSYKLPVIPALDVIDEILLYSENEESNRSVTNRDEISTIIDSISTYKSVESKENESLVTVYAVSNSLGGVFQIGNINQKDKKTGDGTMSSVEE